MISLASQLIDMCRVLSESRSMIIVRKTINGDDFFTRQRVQVPAGEYILVGPDETDNSKIVIQTKNYQTLYRIKKDDTNIQIPK